MPDSQPAQGRSQAYNQVVGRFYAWLEGDTTTCECRAFLEFWGAHVEGDSIHVRATLGGQALDLSRAAPTFDGRFWRGTVRGLAEAVGGLRGAACEPFGAGDRVRLAYQ